MWEALGHILPIAVAMAISSVPIMATILILQSPNRRRSSIPFLIGSALGMAGVLYACIGLAQVVPVRKIAHPQTALGISLIAVGAALLVLAVVSARRSHNDAAGMPRWLSAVGSIGPVKAAGLALVLNVRPKALLLSAAAGLSLRGAHITAGETAAVVGIYTVIAVSSVAGPIIFFLVSPRKATAWLLVAQGWVEKNSRTVTVLILFVIGIVVIGDGLARL